ncbi:MAG: fibronectin type III domain-containing protein, partial [Clostridiales bacterium]|nr:fibronectin type III domain-containing protein [Clostridiales bacterium]
GEQTLYFTINPKSTSLSTLTATKKGFTAKWKKQSTQTSGYQIMYATNSKFTSGKKTVTVSSNKTTSKKITKLKAKKKYYVKVRTYKKVGSTKYYSSWSKVKTVKTK